MATYIGRGVKRLEDRPLVTGSGAFIDDFKLPGMLHAAVLRSPHAHARIKSIDVAAARNLPGVVAVATADDLEGTYPYVPASTPRIGVTATPPPAHPLLAMDRVRYVGEPMAVVVAENRYTAQDALEHIQAVYEPLPVLLDLDEALEDKIILHEQLGTNVVYRIDKEQNDPEDAFRRADRIVSGSFESPRVSPAPMENRGIVATYDREADLLTVWNSTQAPHEQKSGLVHVLKRDPKTIRVVTPDVGGGFGQKIPLFPDVAAICYLATKLERPIKWIEDRAENMTAFHARGMTTHINAAITNDGAILGIRARITCDMGAYFVGHTTVPSYQVAYFITGAYKTPGLDIKVRGVVTNKPTTGPYRGAGRPEAAYFMERTIDLIAAELGLTPIDVRKKNLLPSDAFPYTNPMGMVYDSGDYHSVLERVLKLAAYEKLRQEQAQARAQGRLVGIGIATFTKAAGGSGPLLESTSRVEIGPDGHVKAFTEALPTGQGTKTTFTQIAADVLDLALEDVTILHGDTDMLEAGIGAMASRGVMVSGTAVYQAVQDARGKMAQIGADLFKCSPEEVEFRDRYLFPRDAPERRVPFADVAARAFQEETLPPGLSPGLEFTASIALPSATFPFGAHIMLVEVDRDTGEVKLLRCVGIHDCGKIINPILAEGQFHGGLAQGIGQAMTEAITYNSEGQPQASTFLDYAMPLAEDMPELVLDTQETPSPITPLEVKGLGEFSTVGSPAAVANAVMDALSPLGVRHLDTPYTPEKLWRVIHEGKS